MPAESTACHLCGLPVIGRAVRDREHDFCCEGCRRVYATAEDAGIVELLAGPDTRSSGPRGRARGGAGARKAAAAAAAGARRETLRVDGMWCASCGLVLEDALMTLPGVLDAEASYSASMLRVTWDPAQTALDELLGRVALLGYRAAPAREVAQVRGDAEELFLRGFVSAVVAMWVMWPTYFVLWPAFATGDFAGVRAYELFTGALSLVVLVYGGWPFLAGAWRAARVRRATMDTLVVLGTSTAWAYSTWATMTSSAPTYFESAAMIVTIVLVGRWLEAVGTRDATASLSRLTEAAEESAWLLADSAADTDGATGAHATQRVPLAQLTAGASVLVRAGERVPVDGVVTQGESEVDRSRLTGEPLPAAVGPGDEVWAGTVNLAGMLRVRSVRVGSDTLAGRLAALAEDAAFAKSSSQRIADTIAAIFVPVVIAIAATTVLIGLASGAAAGEAIERAVAVLVVACPCALALATPLAIANAIGAGAERGLLLRGGPALERAGRITTVAFDKTGTLTSGTLSLAGVLPHDLAHTDTQRVLRLAAAVEIGDPHPVAAAIVSAAPCGALPVVDPGSVQRQPGAGLLGTVEGMRVLVGSERLLAEQGVELATPLADAAAAARRAGQLVVWVAADGVVLGGLRFTDELRPETADAIAALHAAGVRTAIVSGDAAATCEAIAARLGIDEVRAEMLPHDKERAMRELGGADGSIAFVGDGINDAAALGAADLAVAVGGGADVAVLSADVVLTREGSPLSAMPALLRLATRTRRVIAENLAWAFSYNLIAIPLAVTGRLSPVAAAAAMALSSLAVVANSWRARWALPSE